MSVVGDTPIDGYINANYRLVPHYSVRSRIIIDVTGN